MILNQLNEYNVIFTEQHRKNQSQKVATIISTILHIFAYLPLICNLLCLIDGEIENEFLAVPVISWFVAYFKTLRADYISFFIGAVILLWIIPLVAHIVVTIIFNFANKNKTIPELEGDVVKLAARLHSFGDEVKFAWISDRYVTKASAIFGIIVGLITIVLVFTVGKYPFSVSVIIGGIICSALLAGVAALLSLPLRWLTEPMKLRYKKRCYLADKNDEVDKIWLSIDPEEAERREKAKKAAEYRARQEQIKNETQIVINYDNSIDTYGNLSFTVYIDGNSHHLRPGRNAFTVTPGNHTLNCIVYNDGSESCSDLGEISCYVAAGDKYFIDIPG